MAVTLRMDRDLHVFGIPMQVTGMGTHRYRYGSHLAYPSPRGGNNKSSNY